MSTALIAPDQHFLLLTCLFGAAFLGMYGERKGWFGQISGVLVTLSATAIISSLGLIPSASDSTIEVPVYNFVFSYVIPLSIPLLLFNVQLQRIFRESGRLLIIYLIGALGVVLGAIIAALVIDLGEETYKVAGIFIGTYIGGSVNFLAIATTFDFLESPLFPSTIAVDNVFTNFYIMFLFLLPAIRWLLPHFGTYSEEAYELPDTPNTASTSHSISLMEQMTSALLIAAIIAALAYWLGPLLAEYLNTDIQLEVLLITLLITLLANIWPKPLLRLEKVAFDMGMLLMFFFLAVIGAATDIKAMLSASPGILLFAAIVLAVHLMVSLIAGKLLGLSLEEIAIASCANAGGSSVSAPMAATWGMKKAVSPAILIGILGYVIGTVLGISAGLWLQ
ncbi:MAG: DUF819 family protein [Bacteroidota bacterium]